MKILEKKSPEEIKNMFKRLRNDPAFVIFYNFVIDRLKECEEAIWTCDEQSVRGLRGRRHALMDIINFIITMSEITPEEIIQIIEEAENDYGN